MNLWKVIGNELDLNLRPSRESKPGLATGMGTQVVLDDQPAIGQELDHDLLT
jgi:hypothetical protein